MTDRLSLYNAALAKCSSRALVSLTENREPRRLLDSMWADGGVRKYLEMGQWNFAMRTVQIDADPSISPSFGYRNAFGKNQENDYVLTCAVCQDEYFNVPLTQYADEGDYIFADIDPIYFKYVSDDPVYGGDFSLWPETFTDYVASDLAKRIAFRLTQSQSKVDMLEKMAKKALVEARSKDAMKDGTKFMPPGTWSSARMRGSYRRDGGNRGSLIG